MKFIEAHIEDSTTKSGNFQDTYKDGIKTLKIGITSNRNKKNLKERTKQNFSAKKKTRCKLIKHTYRPSIFRPTSLNQDVLTPTATGPQAEIEAQAQTFKR